MLFFVTLILCIPISFSAFIVNQVQSETIKPTYENTGYVCYNKNTGQKYTKINAALSDAKNGDFVYLVSGTPDKPSIINCNEDLLIEEGVTFIIPYLNEEYINSDFSKAKVDAILTTTLNIYGDITIEGRLILGGGVYLRGLGGNYSKLSLSDKSQINVCDGGLFECYGVVNEINPNNNGSKTEISGKNLIGDNGVYDNSNDLDRLIHLEYGSQLITTFYNENMSNSGTELKSLLENLVCPFNLYTFNNLQTYVKIDYGAKLLTKIRFSFSGVNVDENVELVTANGLFRIKDVNSYMGIEYCNSSLTRLYIFGNLDVGKIILELPSYANIVFGTNIIDTSNYFLPLHYKFNLFTFGNGVVNVPYNVKLLPGAVFKIGSGTNVIIGDNAGVSVFSGGTFAWQSTGVDYGNINKDALLINNGSLILNADTSKLGGKILTESTDETAIVDVSRITDQNSFTLTTIEGKNTSQTATTICNADFVIDDAILSKNVKAGTILKSNNCLINNKASFVGDFVDVNTISVNVVATDYKYKVISYRVYVSNVENPAASEMQLISTESETTSKSFTIGSDQYFLIDVDSRVKNIEITNPKGEIYVANKWLKAKDLSINITPNEGVAVAFYTTSVRGAGAMLYEVFESLDNGNNFISLGKKETGPDNRFILVKGAKFYAVESHNNSAMGYYIKKDVSKYLISEDVIILPQVVDDNVIINTGQIFDFGSSFVYEATNSYTIYYKGTSKNDICFDSDTIIQTSFKESKKVKDLKTDDKILTYNHYSGKFEEKEILSLIKHPKQYTNHLLLKFENGNCLDVIGSHELFMIEDRKYIDINYLNVESLIGKYFGVYENGKFGKVKLIDYDTYSKFDYSYSLISRYNLNTISNNFISMTPNIEGTHNYFELDENFNIIKEKMISDINKYGLYYYEDFENLVSKEIFDYFNFKYFKVSIGKGLMTYEELLSYISDFNSLVNDGSWEGTN